MGVGICCDLYSCYLWPSHLTMPDISGFLVEIHRWRYKSASWRWRWIHQCQLHQDSSGEKRVCLHRLSGSSPYNCGRFLADGLGAEIHSDSHDDSRSRRRKNQMPALLAKHSRQNNNGQRQAAPGSCENAATKGLCGEGNDPRRHSGKWIASLLLVMLISSVETRPGPFHGFSNVFLDKNQWLPGSHWTFFSSFRI